MGSYISATKFCELPFRTKKLNPNNKELIFPLNKTNEEIIEALNHIQTITNPTNDDLIIINEVLKKNPKLEEIYFLDRNPEEIKKYCNSNVKVYTQYNPAVIN